MIALIATTGSVLVAIISKMDFKAFLAARKAEKETADMSTNLMRLAEGLRVLENQSDDPRSGIDRAIMFEGHDGGGEPRIGEPYYIDVVHPEVLASDGDDIRLTQDELKKKYSNLQVDSAYIQMLIDIIHKKDIVFDVDTMEDCLLKKIYEQEKVKQSIVSIVAVQGNSIIYMSQASYSGFLTDGQILQAKIAANQMRQLIK